MRLKKDDLTFVLDGIKRYGDSNLFPRPFELDFIDINEVKVDLNKWNPVGDLRYLVPKNNSSFRTASLLDPTDILLYNTFLFSLIKNNVEIYNKNYVYSDIFKVDDEKAQYIDQNYKGFMEETLSLGGWCGFILSTDIADFFPRIYMHDIERAFYSMFGANEQNIISKFLRVRNVNESISVLPVGPTASGIVSNLVLQDVDNYLKSKGIKFIRYVDDYRFFADTENEAYEILYLYSDYLHSRYNLTLQGNKTKIYSFKDYNNLCKNNFETLQDSEIYDILHEINDIEFQKKLDLAESYEELDDIIEKEISKGDQDKILHAINTELVSEIEKDHINIKKIKKILNIGYRYNIMGLHNILFDHKILRKVYVIIPQILKYTNIVKSKIHSEDFLKIKSILFDLLDNKEFHLNKITYYKVWILDFFEKISDHLGEEDKNMLIRLYDKENDILVKRYIILILGNLKVDFWFREKKKYYLQLSEWERRAFVYSFGKCNFSIDERRAFDKNVKDTLGIYDYFRKDFLLLGKQ